MHDKILKLYVSKSVKEQVTLLTRITRKLVIEFRTMDKVQKPSSNECSTPSSGPYRGNFMFAILLVIVSWWKREVSIVVSCFYCILRLQWRFLFEWLTWDPRVCIPCCWKLVCCLSSYIASFSPVWFILETAHLLILWHVWVASLINNGFQIRLNQFIRFLQWWLHLVITVTRLPSI
jgi:hypothetical protein